MATETPEVKTEEVKTEAPTDVSSENGHNNVEQRIIRQVEYYFGDYNLLRDKFLKEQTAANDGWVPMETMVKFKRLAELSTDFDLILGALKKSTSGLMEIDEENKKIRRTLEKPLPEDTEDFKQKLKDQTVYCKGFPRDSTIDDILGFFNQFEGVEDVRLRYLNIKTQSRTSSFKGSLTVLFKSKDLAEKFLNLPAIKYGENELLRQWLTEWEQEKNEQFGARNKRKTEAKESKGGETGATEVELKKLPRGTVVKITELPEGANRDAVKEAFGQLPVEVAYVEQRNDDKCFYVRFRGENDAKTVLEKLGESKLKVKDAEVSVALVEGDDEEKYLTKVEEDIQSRVKQIKGRNKGGRGRGRGRGRGFGRGFKRSRSPGGGRAAKKSRDD